MKLLKTNNLLLFFISASIIFFSCEKKEGCIDPSAINYDEEATKDNGSCVFPKIIDSTWSDTSNDDTTGTGTPTNIRCLETELDTACLTNAVKWKWYSNEINKMICNDTLSEIKSMYQDSGLLIMNFDKGVVLVEDWLEFYNILNSTDSTTTWRNTEDDEDIIWTILLDDPYMKRLQVIHEYADDNPNDNCKEEEVITLTLLKIY